MSRLDALLDLLACPRCGAALTRRGDALRCARSEHEFPVVHGVPVLFEPEEQAAIERDYGSATQMQQEYHASPLARARTLVKRAIGSSLRLPPADAVRRVHRHMENEWTLEIGSGTKEAGPRRVQLDIKVFNGVDVVGSGCRLPFKDGAFAMVRNLAVLEHVREPQRMLAEILRVLQPGGFVYTEIPFLQHFHAYPNDFQRLTLQGLRQAFAGCEVVADGVVSGPSSAITALIADWCELWTFSQRRWLNDLVRSIPLALLWPLKFCDWILVKNPRAHEVCSGIYLLCRKPDVPSGRAAPARERVQALDYATL